MITHPLIPPNIPAPNPRPLPSPGVPGGAMPDRMLSQALESPPPPRPLAMPDMSNARLPEFRPAPITRSEELSGAKEEFLAKTPGRFKSGVLNALRGFAGGLQTGGGLGAGLGGAVAGGAFGAINPRGAREMEFEQRIKPQIYERFGMEDQERVARMQAEKALREDQAAQANIANVQSQIGSRAAENALNQEKFDFERGKPTILSPGQVALGRDNTPVFTAPTDPRQGAMTDQQAEAALTGELGTVEEESRRSLEGRREMLKKHLTPNELRIINGQITKDDSPATISAARAKWQKIQDDEFASIRRDTGERRKAKVSNKRFGRKGQPGRTAISVSEAADLLR